MALDNYTQITVKSGNTYRVRSTIAGLDAVSPALSDGGVTINRVRYFARAVYTLTPKYRGFLEMHAYREGFDSPTDSARVKLRHELAEAAGIYAREHTAAMVNSYTAAIDGIAMKNEREACELHAKAAKLEDQSAALLRESSDIKNAYALSLCN